VWKGCHPVVNFICFVNWLTWRPVHILVFFNEWLECCVIGMDGLCMYSEKINKESNINEEDESSSLVRKEDCYLEFTTDQVK